MTVRIEDGVFKSAKKADQAELDELAKDTKARVVDVGGLWLCPGLVDCREYSSSFC